MTGYGTILFDLDHTLLDTDAVEPPASVLALRSAGARGPASVVAPATRRSRRVARTSSVR